MALVAKIKHTQKLFLLIAINQLLCFVLYQSVDEHERVHIRFAVTAWVGILWLKSQETWGI